MADNENINFTTDIIDTEIYEQDVEVIDETKDVVVETEIETIEVFEADATMIESDSAFSPIGEANESLRHTLLTERDVSDQHPITAITGLRGELDDIEALKTVYADKRNQANYFLWEDENVLQENRTGYFVSVGSDINEIKICTSNNDIFGVTVDSAGFIGAQADITRDIKYGLVVTTGLVHVRCEQSVSVGDYVISNDYGYAKKDKNGYKVVGRHQIDGVEYVEITLVTPIGRMCELTDDVEELSDRMGDAESNIVAAMNVANAAYNKAGEVGAVSEEAIKNAFEALDKANGASEKTDGFEERLSTSNALAEEAKNIALLATTTAAGIANAAVETSNKTLANVNNLIADLEPITTWSDPETGNTGAEYFTTYVKDGVATKAEIQTVETLTNDNKSAIAKSAEEFSSLVSSVDKYSVGEHSQSYGLTREQAKSILKIDMIYVPTKHSDSRSHSEIFADETEPQWFTPGSYYKWDGNDWVEYGNSVAFFSEEPIPSNALQYWYVDSNEAPEGYEAHALYMYDGEQWRKVNILDGNVNNRLTSMIRQDVDEVRAEVVNAYGSVAGFGAKLSDTDAKVNSVASWPMSEGVHRLATIEQKASGDDSSLVLAAGTKEDGSPNILSGATIVLNDSEKGSYIQLDADKIDFTAGEFTIEAEHLDLTGKTIALTTDSISIESDYFSVNTNGYMTATGGTIGGWKINTSGIHSDTTSYVVDLWAPNNQPDESGQWILMFTDNTGDQPTYPFVVRKDGVLIANKAQIAGDSNIGGWTISGTEGLIKENDNFKIHIKPPTVYGGPGTPAADFIVLTDKTGNNDTYPFVVTSDGTVRATKAIITGDSIIEGDCTIRGKLDGAGLVRF